MSRLKQRGQKKGRFPALCLFVLFRPPRDRTQPPPALGTQSPEATDASTSSIWKRPDTPRKTLPETWACPEAGGWTPTVTMTGCWELLVWCSVPSPGASACQLENRPGDKTVFVCCAGFRHLVLLDQVYQRTGKMALS